MNNQQINIEFITPIEYKSLKKQSIINYGFHPTIFGNCLIGLVNKKICYLSFSDHIEPLLEDIKLQWPRAYLVEDHSQTEDIIQHIFNNNNNSKASLSILLKGTPFQSKVWEALAKIPFGSRASYEDIAIQIGNSKAVRAVASSIAKNNVSYLIPCHRVIKKSGEIHKYRWGEMRKVAMLKWESA